MCKQGRRDRMGDERYGSYWRGNGEDGEKGGWEGEKGGWEERELLLMERETDDEQGGMEDIWKRDDREEE